VIGFHRIFSSGALPTVLLTLLLMIEGCVTWGQVTEKNEELTLLLDRAEVPAKICTPTELAEARTNLEFALYESSQGETLRAGEHLTAAERWVKLAWEGSRGEECEPDTDFDGYRDSLDKCPKEREDYDGDRDEDGCEDADLDGDGIDDEVDQCPKNAEDFDGFKDEDGCPESDNDNDGLKDTIDRCPLMAEDIDGFQDDDGCPDNDNDNDKIPDAVDKCPDQPEDVDGDQDLDGCPDIYKNIVVTEKKIELRQKIFFATGKARILGRSFGLLNEVADVIIKNPSFMVRIEGHTDSHGKPVYNKKLSQKRADSVKAYLTEHGAEPSRLIAVGYGEEAPIDSNDRKDGRSRNRRVEFHIIR
jgi:outer membrane protein OmpA-like peptidoglycan-associated protein